MPVAAWVAAFAALTLALLLGGGYERVERFAVFKVGLFTLITVLAAFVLTRMPQYFSWPEVLSGLSPALPTKGLATAVAVFGITGVGATELVMYPYWCVEKGYAQYVGRREETDAWRSAGPRLDPRHARRHRRLHGHLHRGHGGLLPARRGHPSRAWGRCPPQSDMIPTLSHLYTQTLGPWALWLFYAGAVVTLYGTIFAANAAHSRIFADMARLLGAFAREDHARRTSFRRRFLVFVTLGPALLYLVFESPVKMVVAGGIAQALMLPALGVGALYLRHRRLPPEVAPGPFVTAGLWVATLVMTAVTFYSLWLTLRGAA